MLTAKGSFVLAVAIGVLFLSIVNWNEPLAVFGISVVLWIWLEWIWFQPLVVFSGRLLNNCTRSIDGNFDEHVTMVTDRTYDVILSGELVKRTRGYRLLIQDTIPDTFEITDRIPLLLIDSKGGDPFTCRYSMRSPMCGKMSLPGICVEVSDVWGFFRTEQFVSVEQKPTVLPYLIRPQTTVSVLKHNNLQRHIGHHRHRSSGVSSELIGIRDYRVGDPPRTIAWKPTARLGKLMTCEFENEVPIRATMIVDLASYQFEGRPGPAVGDVAIAACASIAKLLLADRDPVAAMLLTSHSTKRIDHGAGERQLTRILQYLLAVSNPNPPMDRYKITVLTKIVFENCSRRFPELFHEQFNRGPARRKLLRWRSGQAHQSRRALAVALEHLLDLEIGNSTRMQYDDESMRGACLRYVDRFTLVSNSSSVVLDPPWTVPGKWQSECRRMTKNLCRQLSEAKSRARDNELFVLIAPGPIERKSADEIKNAIKSTVAARHRVVFVAPELPVFPKTVHDPVAKRIFEKARQNPALTGGGEIDSYENREQREFKGDLANDFRLDLISLGATFARINDPALLNIVAAEIGLLQSGKSRGTVLRSR